jgi:hypothetical protein
MPNLLTIYRIYSQVKGKTMSRSFLIAALLAVGLTACGEKPAPAPKQPAPAPAPAATPAPAPAPAPTPAPADAMKADAPKADDAKSTPPAPTGDTKKDPKQPG